MEGAIGGCGVNVIFLRAVAFVTVAKDDREEDDDVQKVVAPTAAEICVFGVVVLIGGVKMLESTVDNGLIKRSEVVDEEESMLIVLLEFVGDNCCM